MRNVILNLGISAFALFGSHRLSAQIDSPCNASPLDVTKSSVISQYPSAYTGFTGGCGGYEAYSQKWWSFRPKARTAIISVASINAMGISGGMVWPLAVIYESDGNCKNLRYVDCNVASSLLFTFPVTPGKIYYIGPGCETEACTGKYTIGYDKNALLSTYPKPNISGSKTICKNSLTKFCASSSLADIEPDKYKWSIIPSTAGTVNSVSGEPNCAAVYINNPPVNGKFQVCVEPIFSEKPFPTTEKATFEVEVLDIKKSTCDISICPEQRPFDLDIISCIRNANPGFTSSVTPSTYTINLVPGTKKTQVVNYTLEDGSCSNSVTLNMEVLKPVNAIILPPLLLSDGEIVSIKGYDYTCTDGGTAMKSFTKLSNAKPYSCDTSFKVLVQCLKITPKIIGVAALDCTNKQVILNGATSLTLPLNTSNPTFQGTGTRLYLWSKNGIPIPNANQATLAVDQPGTYELTVKYTYQVNQTINGQQGVWSKTYSKSTSVEILGSPNAPIAETPMSITNTCANVNDIFFVHPDSNATAYRWYTADGGTIIGSNSDPKKVEIKNNGKPYQLCLVKTACKQNSTPNCITVNPIAPPTKPIIIGSTAVCFADSSIHTITNNYSASQQLSWSVTNGTF